MSLLAGLVVGALLFFLVSEARHRWTERRRSVRSLEVSRTVRAADLRPNAIRREHLRAGAKRP